MKSRKDYNGWRRYACAAFSFLECLLFSGLIYGWTSLVYIFKHEGIYSDLCGYKFQNESISLFTLFSNVTKYKQCDNCSKTEILNIDSNKSYSPPHYFECREQDDRYTLTFTIASTIFCASCAVFGQISLKCGTRFTRIISMISFTLGALMLAFTSKELPWLMMPGLTFLGVGGLPVFVTNVQVSNLFGRSAASIVGALGGAYDSSPVVLLLAKIAFENGVGHEAFMIGLACCHSLLIVNTFFFLPKSFIAKLDSPNVEFQVTKEIENNTKERLPSTKESKQSLRGCIFSPIYIIHVSWICILQLRFYYLLGTLNPFLHKITNTNEALVSHFTDVIGYCMLGGLITTTFAGVVYDWQKHLFKDKQTDTARKLLPTVLPLCTASGLSLLMSILLLIPSVKVLYVTFIIMTLMRSFLYGIGTSFLVVMYPSEYFAMLYGIMIVAGGLTSALQYALYSWAQAYDNGYFHVDIFLLVLVVISFGHPVMQYLRAKRSLSLHRNPVQHETEILMKPHN